MVVYFQQSVNVYCLMMEGWSKWHASLLRQKVAPNFCWVFPLKCRFGLGLGLGSGLSPNFFWVFPLTSRALNTVAHVQPEQTPDQPGNNNKSSVETRAETTIGTA